MSFKLHFPWPKFLPYYLKLPHCNLLKNIYFTSPMKASRQNSDSFILKTISGWMVL